MKLEIDVRLTRKNFQLEICQGIQAPITGIFGASGTGKTTLLAIISGLIRPNFGRIVLNDQVLLDTASGIMLPPQQRAIGLMFQDAQLFPHLNVLQNLNYGFKRRAPQHRRFQFDDIVQLLEIETLLKRQPQQLSGGEKQRVALGRAILYSPQLLLLDEPLSSLDDALKNQILAFLKRVHSETQIPMLYVSHAMHEIQYLTDQVINLNRTATIDNFSSR